MIRRSTTTQRLSDLDADHPPREDRTYVFGGGLGDVIISLYWNTGYEELLQESAAWVVCGTGNPHVLELFHWEDNARNWRVLDASIKRMHLLDANYQGSHMRRLLRWAGRNPDTLYTGVRRNWQAHPWEHRWQAPDLWIPSEKYVVIQPFAGLKSRDIPEVILCYLVERLCRAAIRPILVTRDFLRVSHGHLQHSFEELPPALLPHQRRGLSVPATLELTRNAAGVVSMHSSLVLAGTLQNRKTLAVQNKMLIDHKKAHDSWYFFYETCPHVTTCRTFEAWRKTVDGWIGTL